MRKKIGYIFILLFLLLALKIAFNYKAIWGTMASIFAIIAGKSQLEDKTAMLLYFLGIVLEISTAFLLLYIGIKKLIKNYSQGHFGSS